MDVLLEVGDLTLNSPDLSVNLSGEPIIDRFTLLLGGSLDGEGVVEVGLNLVEDVKDVVNEVLGNLDGCALDHLGEEGEHGAISVGESPLGGGEASELGAQAGEHAGLEEFLTTTESGVDDSPALLEHGADGGVLLKDGIESVELNLSLSVELLLHGNSVSEFLLPVGELGGPGVLDGDVNGEDTGELGDVSFSDGDGVLEEVGIILALGGGNLIGGIGVLLLLLKALADTLDGVDDVIDILGLELELDGLDEGLTEVVLGDLSEDVVEVQRVGGREAADQKEGGGFH